MNIHEQKVAVLVDEANLRLSAKNLFNRFTDWEKVRDYLANESEGRHLTEMIVYIGLPPAIEAFREQREKLQRFVAWLQKNGFLVVTHNGSPGDEGRYKANVDVLMAIDGLEFAIDTRPDIVVLVTGDADFAHFAMRLRRRGIRVEVAAVDQNLGCELRTAASSVIDLAPLLKTFPPLNGDADEIGTTDVLD